MVADPGGPPIPADYTRPGMTESANDRPAEDAQKPSAPPSSGRRNRLAAADARSQRILILVLRAIFVVVLISVVVLTVASNRTSALDFGFSTVVGLLISAAIALPLGIAAALRPGSLIDHACRLISTAGVSLPTFVSGLLLKSKVKYFPAVKLRELKSNVSASRSVQPVPLSGSLSPPLVGSIPSPSTQLVVTLPSFEGA